MKITIIVFGKGKSHFAASWITDYLKRLSWGVAIKELDLKQSLSPQDRVIQEGNAILDVIPKGSKVVALDENGKNITSESFASLIGEWQNDAYSHVTFIIGGAYGLSRDVKQRADILLSFGQMTWPHMMVRLMLVEQLYRASTILSGHPYHKI